MPKYTLSWEDDDRIVFDIEEARALFDDDVKSAERKSGEWDIRRVLIDEPTTFDEVVKAWNDDNIFDEVQQELHISTVRWFWAGNGVEDEDNEDF